MGKHEQVPGNAVRNELLGFVRAADEKSAMACRGPVSDAPSGGGIGSVGMSGWRKPLPDLAEMTRNRGSPLLGTNVARNLSADRLKMP